MTTPAARRAPHAMSCRSGYIFIILTLLSSAPSYAQTPATPPDPLALARAWDAEHVSSPLPPLVNHAQVVARLNDVVKSAPDLFSMEQIGQSVEGRSINHIWFGHGPFPVLLWSQMHGDEPTATSALFDIFEYVRRHRQEPMVQHLLNALTIHVVPMLNPDGAERFQRRNAQGIDINRDALLQQSPEGRALKALRDRLNPPIGFNLHNQNWRTAAGKTGRPASISLLAVAFDEPRSDNPGRIRAKKTCAVIRDAVEALAPGQVARYDDEFEVRAYGDNLTKWGTSVVLIETGPLPATPPDPQLVRINFVGILTALDALATGRVETVDPARYETLPMNGDDLFYTIVKNVTIVNGQGVPPFHADVGMVATRTVRIVNGERHLYQSARVEDIGDLRVYGALETIDGTGLTIAPLVGNLYVGDEVARLPDGTGPGGPVIATTRYVDLMLLRPVPGKDSYRVERILKGQEQEVLPPSGVRSQVSGAR